MWYLLYTALHHSNPNTVSCLMPQAAELQEGQRRDGFEVGNADGIFESTSVARKTASSTPAE